MKLLIVLTLCCASSLAVPVYKKAQIYAERHPNTETTPNPEYGDYFEGDIEIMDSEIGNYNAMTNLNRRWTGKTAYYSIGSEYSSSQRALIEEGIRDLVDSVKVGGSTCVDIQPRSSQSNYISIQKYSGCSSYIGMIGGSQRMSLVDNCVTVHGTIMHEFLHAFGFYHEQSRTDRDDYVEINYDNIRDGAESNFEKYDSSRIDLLDTSYDYGSVMHYGAYSFAIDTSKPTIVPTDPNAVIGQRTRLSDIDIERVQIFYCCISAADSKYFKHLAKKQAQYCDL